MSDAKNSIPIPLPVASATGDPPPIEELKEVVIPLSNSSISVDYINVVIGEEFMIPDLAPIGIDTSRGGTPIYKDPLFKAVLETMDTNPIALIRGIKCKQINGGTKLVFYQGNHSNHWGFIDVLQIDKTEKGYKPIYNIKIYNSYLKSILKSDDRTQKYFESIQ